MQISGAMERFMAGRAWLSRAFLALDADALRRIVLIAGAILLQSALDLPRDALSHAAGPKIGLLVMAVQLASLTMMIIAVAAPRQQKSVLPARGLVIAVLALCCLSGIVGVRQIALMTVASVTPTTYTNDGTTLDHDAALELLHGHDPYESVTIIQAMRELKQPYDHATPLRAGAFAHRSWLDYPQPQEIRAVLSASDPTRAPPEAESHVSYPALAFLLLVPPVALGLPSAIIITVLSLALFAWAALSAVAPGVRPWLALLLLADAPLLDSALTGALDVTALALLFLAWLRWRDGVWSAVLLGLALATKQQPWFFLPFYAIFIWQRVSWREAAMRVAGALVLFLAINLPFIIHNHTAWLTGVLAPLRDPMFPRGQGLVQLALAGVTPLFPERAYTVLEILAFVVALAWYAWRGARRCPELVFILALLPLWFAWRSLPSYFAFSALPMLALWLAWNHGEMEGQTEHGMTRNVRGITRNLSRLVDSFLGRARHAIAPTVRMGVINLAPSTLQHSASIPRPIPRHSVFRSFSLRVVAWFHDLRTSSLTVWGLWAVTSLYMLVSLILGHHYCDPQFYQYAGDFAVGKLPYRDVAVEYPPLALVVMIIPALPLLPFAGIAPRPDANPHPLHPDPVRYGAYGISFAIFMLACDALTLWLVMRSARRLVPGDTRGTWSGLLYVILIFASGAVLQKFDLIVGALCLAAVFALLAARDGLAWAALIAATLIKGFPLLLAPLFVLWRVAPPPTDPARPQPGGLRFSSRGILSPGDLAALRIFPALLAYITHLHIDWHALRRAAIGGGIVALTALVPALILGGMGGLVHSVAYHTSRGMEIESVPATVVLALGWLPGLGVTTTFDFADLSRDVRSPLVGSLDALTTPVMVLLVLALYGLFWYNRQRQAQHLAERARHAVAPTERIDASNHVLLGAATAVLLTFILCFRALPLHYVLSIAPLVALVRLPRCQQRWWLGMLLAACVAGNVVIGFWHQLVALTPSVALILIARNAALIAALVVLIGGSLLSEGSRRKEVADDIRATNAPSSGDRNHAVAP